MPKTEKNQKEKTPKKAKTARKTAPERPAKTTKKLRVCIALLAVIVIAGGTVGGLWLGGVFKEPDKSEAVAFLSTLDSMSVTQTEGRDLAATYQGEDGNLHLLYKTGSLGSMFIELLTVPEKRTELNAGGEISFTKGTIDSTAISEGITRSTTTSTEHSAGGSVSITAKYGVDVQGVSSSYSVTAEAHYNYTTGKSSSYESSKYKEVGTSISVEETHSCPLSECKVGYYYAYAAYADFDVFLDVTVARNGSAIEVVSANPYYAMSSARPSIVFVESATNNFEVPIDYGKKLYFIDSINIDDIFFVGDGSADNPYEINSAAQLMYIGLMPDKNYKLISDVSLSGWQWVNQIIFGGTLNGNGKTIKDLKLEYEGGTVTTDRKYGLFSEMDGDAVVKDLNFNRCLINVTDVGDPGHAGSGYIYAGILVGAAGGTIQNVTVSYSRVEVNRINSIIGGIAGSFAGTMTECKSLGVTVKGIGHMGQITGILYGVLNTCTVGNYSEPGLPINDSMPTIIYNCWSWDRCVGGMVGKVDDSLAVIYGGSVAKINFQFSGNAGYYPIVGFVAGQLYGRIAGVKIPTGNTVESMKNMFKGFSINGGDHRMKYFFACGYDDKDKKFDDQDTNYGWWWWEDKTNIDNKYLEVGKRMTVTPVSYIIKPID